MSEKVTFQPEARRDRAAVRQDRLLAKLAEVFFKNVRRAKLTESQAAVANLVCEDSLALGRRSVVYDSLADMVQEAEAISPVLPMARSVVHRVLVGSPSDDPTRHELGLAQLGVLRVERVVVDGRERWLVTPLLDWRLWRCGWRNTIERRHARNVALEAVYAAARPYLPALAPEPDLDDALDAVGAEAVAISPVSSMASDALSGSRERPTCAPRYQVDNAESAELGGNREGVIKLRTPSVKQLNSKQIKQRTVQQLNSSSNGDESSRMLNELEQLFAAAHGAAEARREMQNNGAGWRVVARAWPEVFELQLGGLREHIQGGGAFRTRAWFYFQHYFKQAIGCATWAEVFEKTKESFTNQPLAR